MNVLQATVHLHVADLCIGERRMTPIGREHEFTPDKEAAVRVHQALKGLLPAHFRLTPPIRPTAVQAAKPSQ
jgi:hypothetical protein